MDDLAVDLMNAHIYAITQDAEGVPNLLSAREVANYHHVVLEMYNIPKKYFGGTRFDNDPELYSGWWCGRCDPIP